MGIRSGYPGGKKSFPSFEVSNIRKLRQNRIEIQKADLRLQILDHKIIPH